MVISILPNVHCHTFTPRIGIMCNYTHIGDNPIVVGKLDEVDDEVLENVVENMKCASLVIETMKFSAKEEVKRHL